MKKLEENKYLYALVFSIAIIILGMILYPIIDIIIGKFITHEKFVFSVYEHIYSPILCGVIVFILEIIFRKNK